MDGPVPRTVRRIPVSVPIESRRTSQLILSHVDAIALQGSIVLEARPGHWEVVLAHSEEAAKRYDGVSDLAADLARDRTVYDYYKTPLWY
jgi:hypothetical protein